MSRETFNPINLKVPSEEGSVPQRRLTDANHAREIAITLLEAHEKRALVETKVRGMLDGNTPYSQGRLRQAAQSYRTNVNFREAEAIKDDAMTPYYDLFSEVPMYADVLTKEGSTVEQVQWSKVISHEFDVMLKQYDGFDWNMQQAMNDMVAFGKGFVFWPDTESWHFEAMQQSRVLVPDGTSSQIEKLEVLVVVHDFLLHELERKVRDTEAAMAAGWNVSAVYKEMARAMPDQFNTHRTISIEENQRRIRSNDVFLSIKSASVKVASVYVREFDGGISHMIVPIVSTEKSSDGREHPTEFLFEKHNRFEDFRQLFGSLFFDVGDGSWHSIKGLLVKMYPFIEVKNRLRCSVIDNGFLNMSVLVQPTTEAAFNDAALQQMGPVTVLRNGLSLIQGQFTAKLDDAIGLEQHLDARLNRNLAQYSGRPETKQRGNPDPAVKFQMDALRQGSLTKAAVNRIYRQLDHIYREIYRRAIGTGSGDAGMQAKEFIKRCRDKEVPMKAIRNVEYVRAYRNIGNGSPFMRQEAINNTASLVPMMPESGRTAWLNDAISTATNQEMVNRYNPQPAEGVKGQNEVDAVHDVSTMKNNIEPVVSPDQNHMIFAEVYMEAASNAVSELERGANPVEVLNFLDIIGPAILRRLTLAGSDPTRAGRIKAMIQQWRQLSEIADQIRQAVQQQQPDPQQQQQQVTKEQMDIERMQREEARKDASTQNDIQRKTTKTAVDLELKERKTNASIQQKALTAG